MFKYRIPKKIQWETMLINNGFTLIEVVVAMSIIMIVIFAYTMLFTNSYEYIFKAGEKSESLFSAQQNIEYLVALREEGAGQTVELKFSGQDPIEVLGRKQEVGSLITFVSEETTAIRFVTVGNIGTIGTNGTVKSSALGSEWDEFDSAVSSTNYLKDITWGGIGDNLRYLAVGEAGRITASKDGINWSVISSGTINNLNSILWGGFWGDHQLGIAGDLKFVAVGEKETIITSDDGNGWTTRRSGDLSSKALNGICWGIISDNMGYFFAVGEEGIIYTSFDGEAWDELSINWTDLLDEGGDAPNLYDIFWANGKYIAVGESGAILIVNYMPGEIEPQISLVYSGSTNLNAITYGNGKFVAVGDQGTVFISNDGLNWAEPGSLSTTSADHLNDITWSYNRFIAVGYNKIFTSEDGDTWNIADSGTYTLYGVSGR